MTKDMDSRQSKRFEIIDFALKHNYLINPSKGMELYVENIIKFGCCPCDSSRPDCPCEQAGEEIAAQGYCRCKLYWASYEDFRKTLRPLIEEEGAEDESKSKEENRAAGPGGEKS